LALLKTWNRYWSAGVAAYGAVELLTINLAGPVAGLVPPTGDCGTGAVTFNVEPSSAVLDAAPLFGVVGVRGVLEFDVHASANPRSTATPVTVMKFRDINSSRKRGEQTWGVVGRILTEFICLENIKSLRSNGY